MSWRVPVILQATLALIVLGLLPFMPESPRFLMAQGREEEARDFLIKYHGNGNPDSLLVAFELKQMKASINLDGIDKRCGGRWRMIQVIMISVFGQFSGNGLGYFNTVIFSNIGIKSVPQQLGYNVLNQVISATCALTAASFTDRIPRRLILPFGTLLCAVTLGINSGLSAVLDKQTK
ncbi:hypothetical protein Q8F55_001631 [Vanrija albida]|uniref:Major facilitator superfamily (MFS) profile domain-containing protein n=1 Tax=Vanrija albida TaxID=181172 RepID=A0ABR3Q7I8_9TREE